VTDDTQCDLKNLWLREKARSEALFSEKLKAEMREPERWGNRTWLACSLLYKKMKGGYDETGDGRGAPRSPGRGFAGSAAGCGGPIPF
jgi:hypothetical protein